MMNHHVSDIYPFFQSTIHHHQFDISIISGTGPIAYGLDGKEASIKSVSDRDILPDNILITQLK